jgi:putative cell wall-binding protein
VQAALTAFPEGARDVVVVTSMDWPDALGGAALAGALHAPVLLTHPDGLDDAVEDCVMRLGAERAWIVGGAAAVSPAVEEDLAGHLGEGAVTRIGGRDRYETASLVASAAVGIAGASWDGNVFLATGAGFADALAASPLAAARGWPILLVPKGARTVPRALATALRELGARDVIVLGGPAAVSEGVAAGADDLVSGGVERIAGADRYGTALAVARYGVESAGLTWDGLALANGTQFADALAGGVMQGARGSVLLLTPGASLDSGVETQLDAEREGVFDVSFLGGTAALSQSVRDRVRELVVQGP